MPDPELMERMRVDWNRRADEDANYFAAFGRRGQDDREFLSTGSDVVRDLERELKRAPGRNAALEIGCGPGRLMRPMSRHFKLRLLLSGHKKRSNRSIWGNYPRIAPISPR
jgi:hypothetical protein